MKTSYSVVTFCNWHFLPGKALKLRHEKCHFYYLPFIRTYNQSSWGHRERKTLPKPFFSKSSPQQEAEIFLDALKNILFPLQKFFSLRATRNISETMYRLWQGPLRIGIYLGNGTRGLKIWHVQAVHHCYTSRVPVVTKTRNKNNLKWSKMS